MPEEQLPPDLSVPPPEIGAPKWADKEFAQKEEENWSDLDKIKKSNDARWLKMYGWIVVVITIVFTAIFLFGLIIWSLHYMLPECRIWLKPEQECYTWLNSEQLSKIQSVLFSGGMGAVISSVIKRQIDKLNT